MAIFKNVVLIVIFGAVSSIQPNNGQDLELAEARGGRHDFAYGGGKVKTSNGYGVPSKSYGVAHKGYGVPKQLPLFRWDSPPHIIKGKGAHHLYGGGHYHVNAHPGKVKHHGKHVVHLKPVYVQPVNTLAISSGYESNQGSVPASNYGYKYSGPSINANKGQVASAYGLYKKPFTAFKPFKGSSKSPVSVPNEEKGADAVASPAEAQVVDPPAEVIAPEVEQVVAPAPLVPEVVPEANPSDPDVAGAAEPQSEEVAPEETISAEVESVKVDPEQVESLPAKVDQVIDAVEPVVVNEAEAGVVTEEVPLNAETNNEMEAIVESATEVVAAPVEEAESATEGVEKSVAEEENTTEGGNNEDEAGENGEKASEEGGNNNSEEKR